MFLTCTQGCIGALDGSYVLVTVSEADKARYRTRKGSIAVNILAACNTDLQFIYMLTGWEGSAADSRVLRDAVSRNNGLKVPQGTCLALAFRFVYHDTKNIYR